MLDQRHPMASHTCSGGRVIVQQPNSGAVGGARRSVEAEQLTASGRRRHGAHLSSCLYTDPAKETCPLIR